eukprot:scaffold1146_cov399-Prasinococcus_capsulatus_cf.AAC.64
MPRRDAAAQLCCRRRGQAAGIYRQDWRHVLGQHHSSRRDRRLYVRRGFQGLQIFVADFDNTAGYSDKVVADPDIGVTSDSSFSFFSSQSPCKNDDGTSTPAPCGLWTLFVTSISEATMEFPSATSSPLIEFHFEDSSGTAVDHPQACLEIEKIVGCFTGCSDPNNSLCCQGTSLPNLPQCDVEDQLIPPSPPPGCAEGFPDGPTVIEYIDFSASLSVFNQLIEWTGLDSYIECAPDVTVFAPTDTAFKAFYPAAYISDDNVVDTSQLDVQTTKALLQEHIVAQKVSLTELNSTLQGQSLQALQQNKLFISKNSNGVTVDGVQVELVGTSSFPAVNGDLYYLEGVIKTVASELPEAAGSIGDKTIWQLVNLAGPSETSILHYAWEMLNALKDTDFSLESLLDDKSAKLTYFAVQNGAFNSIILDAFLDQDPALVQVKLNQSIAVEEYDLLDLFDSEQLQMSTLSPEFAIVSVDFTDGGYQTTVGGANLLPGQSDIVTANGVIHIVNNFPVTQLPEPPPAVSDYLKYGCDVAPSWGDSYCCKPPGSASQNEFTLYCICSELPICANNELLECSSGSSVTICPSDDISGSLLTQTTVPVSTKIVPSDSVQDGWKAYLLQDESVTEFVDAPVSSIAGLGISVEVAAGQKNVGIVRDLDLPLSQNMGPNKVFATAWVYIASNDAIFGNGPLYLSLSQWEDGQEDITPQSLAGASTTSSGAWTPLQAYQDMDPSATYEGSNVPRIYIRSFVDSTEPIQFYVADVEYTLYYYATASTTPSPTTNKPPPPPPPPPTTSGGDAPFPPPPPNEDDKGLHDHLGVGEDILYFVILPIIGLALIAALIFCLYRRKAGFAGKKHYKETALSKLDSMGHSSSSELLPSNKQPPSFELPKTLPKIDEGHNETLPAGARFKLREEEDQQKAVIEQGYQDEELGLESSQYDEVRPLHNGRYAAPDYADEALPPHWAAEDPNYGSGGGYASSLNRNNRVVAPHVANGATHPYDYANREPTHSQLADSYPAESGDLYSNGSATAHGPPSWVTEEVVDASDSAPLYTSREEYY